MNQDNSPHVALRWLVGNDAPGVNYHESLTDTYDFTLPVVRADMRLTLDGRAFYDGEVRPGMLRVVYPGDRVTIHRKTRGKAAIISLAGPYLRQLAEEAGRGWSSFLAARMRAADPQVAQLCPLLMSAGEIDPQYRKLFLQGIASTLVAIMLTPPSHRATESKGLSDAEFARCVDFADARLDERISVENWAAAIGLAEPEFFRKFQARTHVSPYAWLLDRRIAHAKNMLADPDYSLAALALELGFSSQSHFSDAFKHRVGVPPGTWRRNNLLQD